MPSNKLTKAQMVTALAESTGLEKKAVNGVLDALSTLVAKQLGPEGPGEVTIPGLVKLKAKAIAATQDRQGVNPFTKEPMTFAAKPASKTVRARPVKAIKEAIG